MSTPRTTRKQDDRSGGGSGSSHQGGAHGHAHRGAGDEHTPSPGESTNPPKSMVSGGGGERDKKHSHEPHVRSSKTSNNG
jgi:hypothetical protein